MGRVAPFTTGLLAAAFLIGADASHAHAQSRPARGVIDGVVTDTNLVSLADATVSILGSTFKVVTGANGKFTILEVPAGRYILMVRRLGFAPVSSAVQVDAGETLRASFALERLVTSLDTVKVAGKKLGWRMAEFEDRRKAGFGHFLTRDDIEKRNAMFTSSLVRGIPWVTVDSRGVARNTRPGSCALQVFLDGVALPKATSLDDLLTPKELAGIEVYLGPATVPLQYKTTGGGGRCGVILLWTRDGS